MHRSLPRYSPATADWAMYWTRIAQWTRRWTQLIDARVAYRSRWLAEVFFVTGFAAVVVVHYEVAVSRNALWVSAASAPMERWDSSRYVVALVYVCNRQLLFRLWWSLHSTDMCQPETCTCAIEAAGTTLHIGATGFSHLRQASPQALRGQPALLNRHT